MFELFTERARQVVVYAQEEARGVELKHDYIGTEHLLLGLLREEEGLAARVLESFEITLERVRRQVLHIVGSGTEIARGQIPFTPRAKGVLEAAQAESRELGHTYIGTEHVLLGLTRDDDGVAIRILLDFDATADRIRGEVMRMLSGPTSQQVGSGPGVSRPSQTSIHRRVHQPPPSVRGEPRSATGSPAIDPAWLGGLPNVLGPLGAEIRAELGRAPDVGDLLLACACVPHTPAAQALSELGIDVDQLWGLVERARVQGEAAGNALAQRMRETAQAKELAIEERRLEDAARLRDRERELREDVRAHPREQLAALDELRHRLGLPGQQTH